MADPKRPPPVIRKQAKEVQNKKPLPNRMKSAGAGKRKHPYQQDIISSICLRLLGQLGEPVFGYFPLLLQAAYLIPIFSMALRSLCNARLLGS